MVLLFQGQRVILNHIKDQRESGRANGSSGADLYDNPILCLLSGDGNRNEGRPSFIEMAETALDFGFNLEVWAFRKSTSRNYRELKNTYGERVQLMDLEEVLDLITAGEDEDAGAYFRGPERRGREPRERNQVGSRSRSRSRSRRRNRD